MIVKDIMAPFELYQPTQLKDAFSLLDSYGKDAWKMAGGYDSLDWFKDRVVRPKAVVDLTHIAEMKGIKQTPDGVEIGALTTLIEIENNPVIKAKYRLLSDAVSHVASPQIRNNGTIGGNASQNARCLYFRYGLPCYRAGGTTCFADTPEGINREHALFGADRCIAVSSSDGSPALTALDAQFVIQSSAGQRVVGAQDFFVGPDVDITQTDHDQARGNSHRDPPAQNLGGREFLFREGHRPECLGLPTGQCRGRHPGCERHHTGLPHRGRRRQRRSAPPYRRGRDHQGQDPGCEHRQHWPASRPPVMRGR